MCNLCLRYQGGNAIDMSVNIKLTWNKYKMGMTWVLNDIKMCMTCNLSSDKRLEPPEPPYRCQENTVTEREGATSCTLCLIGHVSNSDRTLCG